MWCCRYVDRCPSLLCDIFGLPVSTSTYRCSHLSRNGGSKVVNLIFSIIDILWGILLIISGCV